MSFLEGLVDAPKRVEETLARGVSYRAAHADSLFVPGLRDATEITAIVEGAGLPINVMAWPGTAPAAELGRLGVRRLSAGSGIPQMLWGHVERLARDFLDTGRSEWMAEGAMPYLQLQALFAGE